MSRNTITAFITALTVAVGLTALFFFQNDQTFTVVFKNAKQLEPGANVYLSGINIGSVKDIDLDKGKVRVLIGLDKKFQNS